MSMTVTKPKARKATSRQVVDFCVHESTGQAAGPGLPSSKIIALIQDGLPVGELTALQECLEVPMETLATKLGISKATLHRRKSEGRLDAAESDRVVRYARLVGKAAQVFGGLAEARQWLNVPQFGLGGAVPLDYAETEMGAREVENLLGRIEHGVYS